MVAWIVIEGHVRVSNRIIFVLANTIYGSRPRLFLPVHNSRGVVFELFQKFSAVQGTIISRIRQRRERVTKIGGRAARTSAISVEP